MRLRQLSLDFFGRFSDQRFDFGDACGGRSDLHIIYGANEAGKTTTMEGFLRLLYGFPHRETYDFLHQRKNLRVSGTIEVNGVERVLTRLPSRIGSLIDASGNPLPEAVLQAHLGGLSESDYRQLLCLDDETIERGGEEIASSKGDIGRLLFSAAAGVSDLSRVLDAAREEADNLYRRRASTTEMARLKKACAEIDQKIKDADTSASAYRRLGQQLALCLADENLANDDRRKKRHAFETVRAQLSALPVVAELDQLDRALETFEDYPQRLDFGSDRILDLLRRQTALAVERERRTEELDALCAAQELAKRNPGLAGLTQNLDTLDTLRSRYMTAELDLGRRRQTVAEATAEMMRYGRDLGVDPGQDLSPMILGAAQFSMLERARTQRSDALQSVETERAEILRLTERLAAAQDSVTGQQNENDATAPVGAILARFAVDRLHPQYVAAQRAVTEAETQLTRALDALTTHGGQLLMVPSASIRAEDADSMAEAHQAIGLRAEQAQAELDEAKGAADVTESEIRQLTQLLTQSNDDLASQEMEARNKSWQFHKDRLSAESAEEFEQRMRAVDRTAAQRVAQASDLVQMRVLERRHAELHVRTRQIQQRITQLLNDQRQLTEAMVASIDAEGTSLPSSPRLLAQWLRRREEAVAAERQLDRVRRLHQDVFLRAQKLAAALRPLFELDAADLEGLLDAARARQTNEQSAAAQLSATQSRIGDYQSELERRGERLAELTASAERASNDWDTLMTTLFARRVSSSVLVHSLEPLRDLRESELRRSAAAHQIESMESDQTAFITALESLGSQAGIKAGASPVETFTQLRTLVGNAQREEAQWMDRAADIRAAEQALTETTQGLADIDGEVLTLARIFPARLAITTLEDLRLAVQDGAEVIARRQRRDNLILQLNSAFPGSDATAIRQALKHHDVPELSARSESLRADLELSETRYTGAVAARAAAEGELNRVSGGDAVARMVQSRTTLEAQIEETALRYLELDAGHRLAEEALRRYRDIHRSDMMARTERIFSELTSQAYTRLLAQYDGSSELLVAVSATGQSKRAQDMSKGTRFQLYLALRAAAYEQLAGQGLLLPFFCDDIFETFDENRTRAACRVMARIGEKGQAIYLTHHRHVLDIARAECGAGVMIHEI
jgi:uncharacterized protein YhaN